MNESLLYKYSSPKEHDVLYKPRTGEEMIRAMQNDVELDEYSDLCRLARKYGVNRVLAHMFKRNLRHIILLQNPRNMSSGHWLSISMNKPRKEIYFFSTYGGKPDREKVDWLDEDELKESNQFINILNDGLKNLQKNGWKIYYNDFKYQHPGDDTAYCGIYTVGFLRSGLNPDEFADYNKKLMQYGINPALFYFNRYFV